MTNTETIRITDRECYETLSKLVSVTNVEFENPSMNNEVLIDFCDRKIEQLDKKAATARERAAERRAAGDALRATIVDLLTDEPKTIAEIVTELDDEDISSAMVVARLTQAKKAGLVEDIELKNEKGKTIKGYKRV